MQLKRCCYCCYCSLTDNDVMTSFSNPNYGLDALNSNCLSPSVDHAASHDYVIVDNVTSLAGTRRYATDNGLPFKQVSLLLLLFLRLRHHRLVLIT